MRRIAHISDLHFGRTDDAVVAALLSELNADRPDLVVVSGDFTQGARRNEFEAARQFLSSLASPWIGVPGNHDISPYHLVQRFFDPFRRYRRYISETAEPVWQDDEIAVIGLNSARPMLPELDWSQGRIGRRQLARAEARLGAIPDHVFSIVVVHHPLLPPPYAPDTRLVGRAAEAIARFKALGVKLTLAGHLHRGYARFLEPVIEGGAVTDTQVKPPERVASRDLLAVQAGSATSTRLRNEPNAYNRIRIEDGIAAVEPRLWTGREWATAERASEALRDSGRLDPAETAGSTAQKP